MKKYEPHELGSIFPPMGDAEYEQLCESLKSIGLQDPIVLHEGKILDGNNRYTACLKVKVQPIFTDLPEGVDPVEFVIRKNLARRNLTTTQRAALAAELSERLKAKEPAPKVGRPAKGSEKSAETTPEKAGHAETKASKVMNVSPRSVTAAKAVKAHDPESFQAMKEGKISLNRASKSADEKRSKKTAESVEFEIALEMIGAVFQPSFVESLKNGKAMKPKDAIELSRLGREEMTRLKPYLENGWTLRAARGYKIVPLTKGHTIRNLLERAVGTGGKFRLIVDQWEITVSKLDDATNFEQAR